MSFTKPRDLVIMAVIVGGLSYLAATVGYGSLPPLPATAGISLAVIAVIELGIAFPLRARIHRKPGTKPVEPLTATRVLVLAKASSVLGAVMIGAWAGLLAYLIPRLDQMVAAEQDNVAAWVGLVCAAALIGAALWLEYCCRTPRDRDETDEHE